MLGQRVGQGVVTCRKIRLVRAAPWGVMSTSVARIRDTEDHREQHIMGGGKGGREGEREREGAWVLRRVCQTMNNWMCG